MEMRALLDLMREDEASVKESAAVYHELLEEAVHKLAIIDSFVGEEDLRHAMEATLADYACHRH